MYKKEDFTSVNVELPVMIVKRDSGLLYRQEGNLDYKLFDKDEFDYFSAILSRFDADKIYTILLNFDESGFLLCPEIYNQIPIPDNIDPLESINKRKEDAFKHGGFLEIEKKPKFKGIFKFPENYDDYTLKTIAKYLDDNVDIKGWLFLTGTGKNFELISSDKSKINRKILKIIRKGIIKKIEDCISENNDLKFRNGQLIIQNRNLQDRIENLNETIIGYKLEVKLYRDELQEYKDQKL